MKAAGIVLLVIVLSLMFVKFFIPLMSENQMNVKAEKAIIANRNLAVR